MIRRHPFSKAPFCRVISRSEIRLLFCFVLLGSPAVAQQPPLGRVVVSRTESSYTVRTAAGELLRGGVVSVFQFQRQQAKEANRPDQVFDEAYWDAMKSSGLNAVRLVFFDPWQRSHGIAGSREPYPFADLDDAAQVQLLLSDLDQAVQMAEQRQMYLMINYHDTGGYRDPDHTRVADADGRFSYHATMNYLNRFWDLVAPRYRDRTHVFYELTNEPVSWHPDDYTAENVMDFAMLYSRVRVLAPETHLVLCSFPTMADFGRSMLDVANDLTAVGVAFDNASIGFHPYDLSDLPHRETPISNLMTRYPVINTEQNFPASVDDGTDDPDAPGFGDDQFGVQSMERLGMSWFHWNVTGSDEFYRNFEGLLLPDARSKGYLWFEERDRPLQHPTRPLH